MARGRRSQRCHVGVSGTGNDLRFWGWEGRQSTREEIAAMHTSSMKCGCGKLGVQGSKAADGRQRARLESGTRHLVLPVPWLGQGCVSAGSLAATLLFSHLPWCTAAPLLGHLLSCPRTPIRTATLHSYVQPFRFYTLPLENFLLLLDPLHHPSSPSGTNCYHDSRCLAAFRLSLTLQMNNLT